MNLNRFILRITLGAVLAPGSVWAAQSDAQFEEDLYRQIVQDVSRGHSIARSESVQRKDFCSEEGLRCLSPIDITIQALDAMADSKNPSVLSSVRRATLELRTQVQEAGEDLHLYTVYRQIESTPNTDWEKSLIAQLNEQIQTGGLSPKSFYTLTAYEKYFSTPNWNAIRLWVNTHKSSYEGITAPATSLTENPQLLKDLLHTTPQLDKYAKGRYKNSPRIYMLCRDKRKYPCLMVIKKSNGEFLTENNSSALWTQPALGYSWRLKKYNQTNGNTPSGVLRVDGVMPEADQTSIFGKYRRLILNFVAPSEDETNHKYLLPASSHTATWWREAVAARDIGRGLFRIHGSGLMSSPFSTYHPFVATSGCVAKRENTYSGITYQDQRLILDALMQAADLEPTYENESKIRALLYIINIDDRKGPVRLEDLKRLDLLSPVTRGHLPN